jgi:hypothetical protein
MNSLIPDQKLVEGRLWNLNLSAPETVISAEQLTQQLRTVSDLTDT